MKRANEMDVKAFARKAKKYVKERLLTYSEQRIEAIQSNDACQSTGIVKSQYWFRAYSYV